MTLIQDIFHYLKESFSFTEGKPLLFTQLFFWVFFALVVLIYSFIYKNNFIRTAFLLLVSLYFYYKTSGVFLILLLFTISSDYCWGKLIHSSASATKRKLFLSISIFFNLFLLVYFKYAYFFTSSFNQLFHSNISFFNHFSQFSNHFLGTHFSLDQLVLPVGISFFTFQSLSYTIDVYRKKTEPVKNIIDYGFFVCFFPHLVAGPIVKAHEFLYQIYTPYNLSRKEFGLALFWILNGLAKKIMADYIAINFIDRIFDNPGYYSGVEVILGILGYSLQIYADFSGYTDMAIGLALILGYRLKTNFLSPYKAQSTSEFWQRWHISLSSWLKNYLYIPLGGNKEGTLGSYIVITLLGFICILLSGEIWLVFVLLGISILFIILAWYSKKMENVINTNINLLLTMLLGGLWHGSSWMFIIWGGLNGVGLILHKFWEKINPIKSNHFLLKAFNVLLTLCFISFTRIWFRSDNLEVVGTIFYRIQYHLGINLLIQVLMGYKTVLFVILTGYLIHWIPENIKEKYRNFFSTLPLPILVLCVILSIFILYQWLSSGMQAFIYFQF